MWKHESKFKGQIFIGGYEFVRKLGKRQLKFKNKNTGREAKASYGNAQQAQADGWIKVS